MLVGVMLASVVLGMKASAAHRQREVVSFVRQLHGECYYEHSMGLEGAPTGVGGQWLCKVLGEDFVYSVHAVALGSHRLDDHTTTIGGMPQKVNDSACERLSTMQELRVLLLDYTDVSGDGIRSLAPLKSLEILDLENTRCTSRSVDWLIVHKNLRILDVRGTKLTDEDVERLRRALPQCEVRH